jgi:hypothetical protein
VRRLAAFALAATALVAVPAPTATAASAPSTTAPKALSPAASDRAGGLPIIRGSVGPGFEIRVSRHQAQPRRFTFIVRDRSSMHNWHIRGPGGVNRSTSVPFTGRREWTIRLRVGTYRIVCDPHSSMMRTRIVVG